MKLTFAAKNLKLKQEYTHQNLHQPQLLYRISLEELVELENPHVISLHSRFKSDSDTIFKYN